VAVPRRAGREQPGAVAGLVIRLILARAAATGAISGGMRLACGAGAPDRGAASRPERSRYDLNARHTIRGGFRTA
jgi:hypothetical protein